MYLAEPERPKELNYTFSISFFLFLLDQIHLPQPFIDDRLNLVIRLPKFEELK